MRDKVTCFGVPCLPTTTFENVFSGTNRALVLSAQCWPNPRHVWNKVIFSSARVQFPDAKSHGIFSGCVFELDLCPLDISARFALRDASWAYRRCDIRSLRRWSMT